MPHILLSILVTLSFAFTTFAQTNATEIENDHKRDDAELEKKAVELLRETSSEVASLRSVENRISFSAELASLMWFHDEREAMAMYERVISDFRQLLTQLNYQLTSTAGMEGDDEYWGGVLGRYGTPAAERKFRVALSVRQQIALSLAEHAPEMAFDFYNDSLSLLSDPERRKSVQESDKYFETALFSRIGEGKAAKALDYGKRSLKNGIRDHHVGLLEKIYAKDSEKGLEFGGEILSRLKSDRSSVKDIEAYSSLLTVGANVLEKAKPGEKALFAKNDLRDIAEQFTQALLVIKEEDRPYMAGTWANQIDKFAPGKGALIRAKYQIDKDLIAGVDTAANAVVSNTGNSNSSFKSAADERAERERAEAKLMEDITGLGTKPLSPEDRQKVIAQARSVIARTPGKDKKVMALNLLAVQVMRAGDKELAAEIMNDAARFVNPQPRHYRDFLLSLMVASGYAETDPDRAFPLLQDMISRINETISAAVKVAEFIDATEEMVVDGEVQVGSFGGSMVREITKELGMANSTLVALADADFERLRGLTNGFDRVEVRVLAKMMVLRAVSNEEEMADIDIYHRNK